MFSVSSPLSTTAALLNGEVTAGVIRYDCRPTRHGLEDTYLGRLLRSLYQEMGRREPQVQGWGILQPLRWMPERWGRRQAAQSRRCAQPSQEGEGWKG